MNKLYSVHDHWTDINKKNDVDIESIDGVITGIKVNGEDYGGGGSSDFSTAKVTIISNYTHIFGIRSAFALSANDMSLAVGELLSDTIGSGMTATAILNIDGAGLSIRDFPIKTPPTIMVSGAIEDMGDNNYLITGDCTITISE